VTTSQPAVAAPRSSEPQPNGDEIVDVDRDLFSDFGVA